MNEYYGGYKEGDEMAIRLIIEGNSVYEIDEECEAMRRKGTGGFGMVNRRDGAGRDGTGSERGRTRTKEKPGGFVRPEFM